MNVDRAQEIALNALAWLVGNEDLLPVFLGTTGATLEDLKAQAMEPSMQLSLLDFMMMDDAWVIEFCDTQKLNYEAVYEARQMLPGGAEMNWT